MKSKKNKKRIDPRYFLNEHALSTQTLDPESEIMIWYNGDWHPTALTDEEHESIHNAFDPKYERLTDVVQRVLSSMRELDIEDVEL